MSPAWTPKAPVVLRLPSMVIYPRPANWLVEYWPLLFSITKAAVPPTFVQPVAPFPPPIT